MISLCSEGLFVPPGGTYKLSLSVSLIIQRSKCCVYSSPIRHRELINITRIKIEGVALGSHPFPPSLEGLSEPRGWSETLPPGYLCWWQVLWQQTTPPVTNACSVICWLRLSACNHCFCCAAAVLWLTVFSLFFLQSLGFLFRRTAWNESCRYRDCCWIFYFKSSDTMQDCNGSLGTLFLRRTNSHCSSTRIKVDSTGMKP